MPVTLPRETLERLARDVRHARAVYRRERRDRVERDLALFKGDHYSDKIYPKGNPLPGYLTFPVNHAAANVRNKVSSLAFRPPAFSIEIDDEDETAPAGGPIIDPGPMPVRSPEETARLPLIHKARLERIYRESGAVQATRAALQDKYCAGSLGVVFTSWDPGEEDPLLPVAPEQVDETIEMMGTPGVMATAVPAPVAITGEGPRTIRISPHDLLIDPSVPWDRWQEASFIGYRYLVPKETLVKAGIKGAKDLAGVYAAESDDEEGSPSERKASVLDDEGVGRDGEAAQVLLQDVWFRKVWCERATKDDGTALPAGFYPVRIVGAVEKPNEPIKVTVWPYDLRDELDRRLWPFDLIFNETIPDELWGQSDVEIQEPQQKELNHSRATVATYADLFSRVLFTYDPAAMDPKAMSELEKPKGVQPGSFLKTAPGAPPDPIRPVVVPPMPSEVIMRGENARRDMNLLVGMNEMKQGVGFEREKKATEINVIANESGGRDADEQAKWEAFVESIAQKQYQLCVQYGKVGDRVGIAVPRAMGGTGQRETVEIGPEHLVPAKVRITTGSTMLADKQQKIGNAQAVLGLLNTLGLLETPMNPNGIYSPRPLVEQLIELLDLGNMRDALAATGEFAQTLMQQQQAQMALLAQAQGMAGAGGPGALPPGGPEGVPEGAMPPPGAPEGGEGGAPTPSPDEIAQLMSLFGPQGGGQGPTGGSG